MRGELDKLITTESSNEIEINSLKSEIKRLEKLLESKKGKSVQNKEEEKQNQKVKMRKRKKEHRKLDQKVIYSQYECKSLRVSKEVETGHEGGISRIVVFENYYWFVTAGYYGMIKV